MPAPGDQYLSDNIKNPFEERAVSSFTAQEIATLQSRLDKQLGPEYISNRAGPGGGRLSYLEGAKAIALANEVFGFNGWSSSLQQVQVDYVDEAQNGKVSLGLSMIVRVTLRDGTYHEDIGYGSIENCKGKAAAFEKAKKGAATDGLKRALRNFGNVLGNCLYDKEYLKKVNSVKVKPIKIDETQWHRHPDFALPPVKTEKEVVKREEGVTPMRADRPSRIESQQSALSVQVEAEDEFGLNDFDGVEISEHSGDEFTFEAPSGPDGPPPKYPAGPNPGARQGGPAQVPASGPINGPAQPPAGRVQSMPSMRPPPNANQNPQQQQTRNQAPPRPVPQQSARGPQTPTPQQTAARADMQRARGPAPPAPTVDIHAPPRPQAQQQHQNQPQRPTPLAQPQHQNQPHRPTPPQAQQPNSGPGPQNQAPPPNPGASEPQVAPTRPQVGFITGRAAELVQNQPIDKLPAFNPHAESPVPKERRTPGIDGTRSMKITRESIGMPPPPPQLQQQQPPPQQGGQQGQSFRPVAPSNRPNFVNAHQDPNRRIGAPTARAMSPLANRNAYKPPGMVGGIKRPPLADVSNQAGNSEAPPDPKKPKLDVPGAENSSDGTVAS